MSARPRVVIVGAGFGGLGCAHALVASKTAEAKWDLRRRDRTDFMSKAMGDSEREYDASSSL